MIQTDHKEELQQEELNELEETPMYEWIANNKESLKEEFLEYHEDEFDAFCRLRAKMVYDTNKTF